MMQLRALLYQNLLKIWNLDLAEDPGFDLPKMGLYYNIGPFLEIKLRELSLRSKTKFSIWFCIALCLASIPLYASTTWEVKQEDGFSAKAVFSEDKLKIPQELHVELELTYPQGYHVDTGALRSHLLRNDAPQSAPFSLVSESIGQPRKLSGKWISQTIVFTLQPELSGIFYLTFLNMPFIPSDSKTEKNKELISEIFPVKVSLPSISTYEAYPPAGLLDLSPALPIEPTQELASRLINNPADIRRAADENASLFQMKAFPWTFIGAVLISFLIYWIWRQAQKRPPKPLENVPMSETAYDLALQALEELNRKPNGDLDCIEAIYLNLSRSVRYHIEEKYHFNAPTQTTQEFFKLMESRPILPPEKLKQLHDFLEAADKIKFAKESASLEECRSAAEIVRRLMA